MKFFSNSFLAGFGSVLSLYPRQVKTVSDLRQLPSLYLSELAPLGNAKLRKIDAEAIRKALGQATHSSETLDKNLQSFAKARYVRLDKRRDGYSGLGSKETLKVKVYNGSNVPSTYSVHTDHALGLADMLAIRGDWENVSRDLASAKKATAHG